MDENMWAIEAPPVITVTFKPRELPSGTVDLEDFTHFLDGLRMAIEGVAEYDASRSSPAEQTSAPYLTIIHVRDGSVICDIIINISILSYNTISLNTQIVVEYARAAILAEGTLDIGLIMYNVMKDVIQGAATDAAKEGIERSVKMGLAKARDITRHAMRSLKTLTTSHTADGLPAEETLAMVPGARKMARVGSKQTYGSEGITISSASDPDHATTFNAESQRYIEVHAKLAQDYREPIELVGTIENPNRGKRRFVLMLPGQSKASERVSCQYEDRRLIGLVDDLYHSREYVKVEGHKRYKLSGNPAKPKIYIVVSRLEKANLHTLVNQPTLDTHPEQAS